MWRRRRCVQHVRERLPVSEHHACRVLDQPRTTQRYQPIVVDDEDLLTVAIIRLPASTGATAIGGLPLRSEGWRVNHKRVERIWRREGLKVQQKQPKRGRLWLNDG